MHKKLLILFLVLSLISISTLDAETTYGTYKQGECMELIQTCGNCTYVNISTVLYPNSSIAVQKVQMTKDNTYYNYTFCKADVVGSYIVNGYGDDSGEVVVFSYDFTITPTGKSMTTSTSITSGLIVLLMFGVTIFFLFFAGVTEVPGVKLFFNVIGYITLFLTIGGAYVLLESSEVQSNMSFLVQALLFVIGIVFIVIMFYIMINQTRQALKLMQIKKGFGSEYDDNPPMF